jgi:molybdopterin-guanine dinucleotide biosynthesis protein A
MTLTAVLLVGGLSTRMGTDKALIEIQGQPLWMRQLNVIKELEPTAVWISAREKPHWCPSEMKVVLDRNPSRGPLSGLAAALSEIQTSHLLLLAIDLPLMTSKLLTKLYSLATPGRGAVAVCSQHFEPLAAIYPREASALANAALNRGDLSLQTLIESLRMENRIVLHRCDETEARCFLNLNSPNDLAGTSNSTV